MKKKNEGIKPNFEGLYFTNALNNFAQIWYVSSEGGGSLQYKNDSNLRREHGAMYT